MKSILIIDDLHPSITSMLEGIGFGCKYVPKITRQELLSESPNYLGLLVRSKTYLDKEVLDKFPNLQFIGRAGAGIDLIDLEETAKRGIKIINAPEGNRDALAEHSLGLLLNIMNHMVRSHQEIYEQQWKREPNRGYELNKLTVGLVGYGFMGQAFAKRLKAMGCTILAYDKYKSGFSDQYVTQASMEEIYAQSDVFTSHVPLTKETDSMQNEAFFNAFAKPIWFLNTARGKIMDTKALYAAIKKGQVRGAGLDVIENEKPQNWSIEYQQLVKDLYATGKFMLTPHVGGWTFESYQRINEVLIEKIKSLDLEQ